jgi:hypothetical protein
VIGQITGESDGIQFFDTVHGFGSGWAVTNRGAIPSESIYHALRTFKIVPSGAASSPSTTKRVPWRVRSSWRMSF